MRPRMIVSAVAVMAALGAGLLIAFVGSGEATTTQKIKTRQLYVSAVEWKGSASVAKEPYPGPVPPGGGYESCAPGSQECDLKGDTTKWAVETYRFDTAVLFAYAGERVVLNAFGVNAAKHDINVPSLKKKFTIMRGVVSTVNLGVIKKPGIYRLLCITHPPAHQADLVVMPKP